MRLADRVTGGTIAKFAPVAPDSFAPEVCDGLGVRVLVFVVLAIGATPAFADVDASKIERARDSALTPKFQDDLPGFEEVEIEGGGGGTGRSGTGGGGGGVGGGSGEGTGGRTGSGSGSAGSAGSGGSGGRDIDDSRIKRGSGEKRRVTAGQNGPLKRDPNRAERDKARRVDTRDTQQARARDEEKGPVGNLLTIVMWGLLAIGAALLVFWFVSEMGKGKEAALPSEKEADDAAVKAATAAIIDRPLGDADDLAAQGKFAEAIHTLLLRTLKELAKSAMVRVEHSHTSREILSRVPLKGDARDALSTLITYVELTHFGDDPASAADYAKCREQFHRFAEAFKAGLAVERAPVALAS
jgi:hypothetical protein